MITSKNKDSLSISYEVAKEIMKDKAASFYQAFSNLPKERFECVAAVYAFCRYADDVVDNDPFGELKQEVLRALLALEFAVNSLYRNLEQSDLEIAQSVFSLSWWEAFQDAVKKYQIPMQPFIQQINGQRKDVDFKDLETLDDLIEYSRLVAGSVGTMLLPIIAIDIETAHNQELMGACENLGIAMQITNILRDVGEDLRTRNRVYLPQDYLVKYKIRRSDLEVLAHLGADVLVDIPSGFIDLWEELAGVADRYYEYYEAWIRSFHKNARMPLVAAALSYRAIADAVRKENYNCFTKRCYTSAMKRADIILQAQRKVMEK